MNNSTLRCAQVFIQPCSLNFLCVLCLRWLSRYLDKWPSYLKVLDKFGWMRLQSFKNQSEDPVISPHWLMQRFAKEESFSKSRRQALIWRVVMANKVLRLYSRQQHGPPVLSFPLGQLPTTYRNLQYQIKSSRSARKRKCTVVKWVNFSQNTSREGRSHDVVPWRCTSMKKVEGDVLIWYQLFVF